MEKDKIRTLIHDVLNPIKQLDISTFDSLIGDVLSLKSRLPENSESDLDGISIILNKIKRLRFLEEQTKNEVMKKIDQVGIEVNNLIQKHDLLSTLFETGKIVSQENAFDTILRLTIDKIIGATGAEKGFIIVRNKTNKLLFEIARNNKAKDIVLPESEVSRNIIEKVFNEHETICTTSAAVDSRLGRFESVMNLGLMSVLCVPIEHDEKVLGVVYLDNRNVDGIFTESTMLFVKAFTEQVVLALRNWIISQELEVSRKRLEEEIRGKYSFGSIIGNSPCMLHVLGLVGQVSTTDATVLIEGESGTGKELIAKAIHFNSERKDNPLVTINCGAIPESLLESELFGHVRGAFTGAINEKKGKFEIADGGTIFLDEIGEMDPALQVKILRVLQFREYSPVGSNEVRHSDVRIIAATNRDLRSLVAEKKFRDDLYYRLNVFRIELPPLRKRKEDIPVLINHFLNIFCKGKTIPDISPLAEKILLDYPYSGNLRELENALQRAVILCRNDIILPEDLPLEMIESVSTKKKSPDQVEQKLTLKEAKVLFEKEYIENVLGENNWVIRQAARAANIDVKNFHMKMKQYGIKAKK
jgi:Nif-specific regulatory protein